MTLYLIKFATIATIRVNIAYVQCSSVECRGMQLSLATNAFCAGAEQFWCWRWTNFNLEMSTFVLETNVLKTWVRTVGTHTAS